MTVDRHRPRLPKEFRRSHSGCLAGILLALLLWGCNQEPMGGPRLETVPITGKVLVDGEPQEGIAVMFMRAEAKTVDFAVPDPEGVTDKDGVFKVGTYVSDDGAIPGKYKLIFIWGQMNQFTGEMSGDKFRGKYMNYQNSPFTVTIPEETGGEAYDVGTFKLSTKG